MIAVNPEDLLNLLNSQRYHDITNAVEGNDRNLYDCDTDVLNIYAIALFRLSRFDDLLPVLTHLESFLQSDSNFLSLFGVTYRRLGNYECAVRYLESALNLDPENLDIKNNLANLNIDLRNLDKAKSLLDDVLELDPSHVDAAVNLKRLQLIEANENDHNQANSTQSNEDAFTVLDPLMLAFSDDEVKRTFANYKSVDDPRSTNLAKAAQTDTDSKFSSDLLVLAKKYVSEGLYNDALKVCTKLLSSLGPLPDIYECASDAYLGLDKFQQAELSLLYAYILGSRGSSLLLNLISLTSMRKDFTLSSYVLEQIQLLDPSCPHISKFQEMLNKHQSSKDKVFSFEDWSFE